MHISVIDDEQILGNKIQKKLESHGFSVTVFFGYNDFVLHGDATSSLYIIDISLGDGSGFDIIQSLRKDGKSKSPIIIMSGYADSEKIVYGLDIGADDYIVKPCIPDELIARVRALLRRPQHINTITILEHHSIRYDTSSRNLYVGDLEIHITLKESRILELFLANIKNVVSREKLITDVWGGHHIGDVSDNTINVTLSRLRKKIGEDFNPKTIYNYGYILD